MSKSMELILEIVESGKPMSVAEIAEEAMVSKATVYRTLKRLEGKGCKKGTVPMQGFTQKTGITSPVKETVG